MVRLSVCLLVCLTSEPCKKAEMIMMPFRLWAEIDLKIDVLDDGPQVVRDLAMAFNEL